jgi:hypothetical protein
MHMKTMLQKTDGVEVEFRRSDGALLSHFGWVSAAFRLAFGE